MTVPTARSTPLVLPVARLSPGIALSAVLIGPISPR